MAFTLNRRLAQLVDSDGKLNSGKVPDNEITSDHLHTSFELSASHVSSTIEVDDLIGVNQHLETTDDVQFNNLTLTGSLRGPATMTIDPAAVGDNTGTLVIAGNLQVDGTTTTINSTTLDVDDLNITLASGAADSAAANGAGLTIDGASATLLWSSSDDRFNFNKSVGVAGTLRAVGSDSTVNNYAGIFRNSGGQNIMLMRNDGVVLLQQSYLYVNNSNGIYTDGPIIARSGILNDTSGQPLLVDDNLDITGNLTVDHGNWTGAPVVNVSTDQFDAGASFATGSFVLFGEHDGTKDKMLSLKKNSSDIFSVNSSGRVGIGTGDADGDLHLNVTDAEIRLQHAGNSYFQRIFTDSNNKLHFGTGANGAIQMSLETNALEFAATSVHASNGNVLINIPDRAATIYNIGDRGNITIQASSATSGGQAMSGGRVLINAGNSNNGQSGDVIVSSGSNIINANDSGKIRFNIGGRTSSEEAMRIHANGNVGIGVTDPGARLELDNPSAFTNMIEYGNVTWNQNTGHGLVAVNRGSDGYVQLQITSGVDNADVFTIRNSGTGAAVQHNLLSNGNAYHAGNVGIGQNNPKTTLNLAANNSGQGAILTLENTDTSITSNDIIGQIDFYANDGSNNGTGAKVNIKGIATSTAGTITALTFGTADSASSTGVERMRIDGSGNVQIGTSNPSGNKAITIQAGTDSSASLRLKNDAHDWDVNCQTNDNFAIYSHTDTTERLIINPSTEITLKPNNGTVIVDGGTADYEPAKVELQGRAFGGDITAKYEVSDGGAVFFGSTTNHDVRFIQNNTERMRITTNGETRRNYSSNTDNSKKWWSTSNNNFGEVYEYDYGTNLYFKKTRSVSGYSEMLLHGRYMPNQYDVSFELKSNITPGVYRHFGIALNHIGSGNSSTFDYLVLRQHPSSSTNNQVRLDLTTGTTGDTSGSSVPNFHDGTKRKIMIQKRANTIRMQVHELNGTVFTYGTITGITWTNSSGYFGFNIYESADSYSFAEISNLTFYDVIA